MKLKKNLFVFMLFLIFSGVSNAGDGSTIVYTSLKGTVYVRDAGSKHWVVTQPGSDMNLLIPELTKKPAQRIQYTNLQGNTFESVNSSSFVKVDATKKIDYYHLINHNNNTFDLFSTIDSQILSYEVYNSVNQFILSDNESKLNYNIDLTKYPKGVYFLKIKTKDKELIEKLLVM